MYSSLSPVLRMVVMILVLTFFFYFLFFSLPSCRDRFLTPFQYFYMTFDYLRPSICVKRFVHRYSNCFSLEVTKQTLTNYSGTQLY